VYGSIMFDRWIDKSAGSCLKLPPKNDCPWPSTSGLASSCAEIAAPYAKQSETGKAE